MAMKNGTNVPSDKFSIISCVPYRACVMVIIRATVAKVIQNNLQRMLAAWVMGREEGRPEEERAPTDEEARRDGGGRGIRL